MKPRRYPLCRNALRPPAARTAPRDRAGQKSDRRQRPDARRKPAPARGQHRQQEARRSAASRQADPQDQDRPRADEEPGPRDRGSGPQDHASTGKREATKGGDRMGGRARGAAHAPGEQRTRRGPGRGSTQGRPGGPAKPGPEPARSKAAVRQIDPVQQPKAAHQVEGQTADRKAEPSGQAHRQPIKDQPSARERPAKQIAERAVQSVTSLDRPAKGTTRAPFLGGEYSTVPRQPCGAV